MLADVEAISLLFACSTLSSNDLITSDHLPLVLDTMYAPLQNDKKLNGLTGKSKKIRDA